MKGRNLLGFRPFIYFYFQLPLGGKVPQPSRAVASLVTKVRATRTVSLTKTKGAPASAGGHRVYVSIATQLRATRRWFFLGRGRVILAGRSAGGKLPQPSRAVASLVTKVRATRTVSLTKTKGAPASAGGHRVYVSIAPQPRASRTVSQIKPKARPAARLGRPGRGKKSRDSDTRKGVSESRLLFFCYF